MLRSFKNFVSEPVYWYLNRRDEKQRKKDAINYSQTYKNAMNSYKEYKSVPPHEKGNYVRQLNHYQSELKRMGTKYHPDIKVKDHYGFLHNDIKRSPLKHWNSKNLHKYSKDFSYTYPEMEKLSQEKDGDLPEEFYTNHFILHPSDRKIIKNEIERREFLNAKF